MGKEVIKVIETRIKENKKLFSHEELKMINNNSNLISKIYLLSIIDLQQI